MGEYGPQDANGNCEWVPEVYDSASAARKDLYALTIDAKDRARYKIRPYRDRVSSDSSDFEVYRAPDGMGRAGDTEHGSEISPVDDRDREERAMTYKVRCTKKDDGSGDYHLSYGRGKAKLTATLHKFEEPASNGDSWEIKDGKFGGRLKRDVMKAWGEWAEQNYQAVEHERTNKQVEKKESKPKKSGPPSVKRKKSGGPPAFKKTSAPASGSNRPAHPDYEDDHNDVTDGDENPYLADFLSDKGLFTRDNPNRNWTLTPIGCLDEVFNWMQENLPFTATMEYPWVRVTRMLQRKFPNDKKYQQTGAE
jgi:hypothetical protein